LSGFSSGVKVVAAFVMVEFPHLGQLDSMVESHWWVDNLRVFLQLLFQKYFST